MEIVSLSKFTGMGIEELNRLCRGTLIDLLKIRFTSVTGSTVEATMEITPGHLQPMGVVHGGALIALAETVGSAGSLLLVDPEQYTVMGSVVNSQHLLPAREGVLTATAILRVKADFKHVWDVEIKGEGDKLISISRVTNSVKPRNKEA
jgi:1,4-dihydroxy-2-naphthoyl-CoA hydrolase